MCVEVKDQLLCDGWHMAKCAQKKGMCGTQRRVVHGLVGLLRRMEGVLMMK